MKHIAIVTGATSGVGREFVRQLDGRYYGKLDEIWAVARTAGDLEALADATYAPVRAFALDLARTSSVDAIAAALAVEEGVQVDWLVNSAGLGWFGPLQDMPAGRAQDMVRVNCLALLDLTCAALPYMAAGSRIVNMASVAAWMPLPHMGLYAATKRFVLDLTRSLNADLAGTGIHACAVCPKALKTGFWREAGAEAGMGTLLGTERVYDVVRKAIAAVERGRGSIVTAPDMKVACALFDVLPYGVSKVLGRAARAVVAHRGGSPARPAASGAGTAEA